jgi:peptide/nickel transport system permease protein
VRKLAETSKTPSKLNSEPKRRNFWVEVFFRMLKEKPLGTFGFVVVMMLLFTGIFANYLAPYPLGKIDFSAILQSPSAHHLLGTDNLGRDVLSNIIYRICGYVYHDDNINRGRRFVRANRGQV